MIENVKIGENIYAPEGSQSINLYSNELAQNLTLGQLIQQICLRAAAADEARSIVKMNSMTSNTLLLEDAASWLVQIATGAANWSRAKTFLVNSLKIAASELPSNIDSYEDRLKVCRLLQDRMTTLAQDQQEDMIDLQSMVSRRDVAYSTASNIVHSLMNSMQNSAYNISLR